MCTFAHLAACEVNIARLDALLSHGHCEYVTNALSGQLTYCTRDHCDWYEELQG